MEFEPKISVVIPAYNAARFLPETIASVLSQTYRNLEILIVDDGSTDNTRAVVESIDSGRIRYLHQTNSGTPSSPKNRGIRKSSGEYIALLDSDDILLPDRIERQVTFFREFRDMGLVFTNFIKFSETAGLYEETFLEHYETFHSTKKKRVADDCYIMESDDVYGALFYENFIGTSGTMIPRAVFDEVGYFDETLETSEDRDLWLRIARNLSMGYIDVIGFHCRVHDQSISHTHPKVYENRIKVMQKQVGNDLTRSLLNQARLSIARNYANNGYRLQKLGEFKQARKNFWMSLKGNVRWRPIKGILVTFLPKELYFTVRKFLRIKGSYNSL